MTGDIIKTAENRFEEGQQKMEYTKLGSTEIEVSKVCVGCMSFGQAGTMHDWTLDESESEKMIKHALELGINFFDTANGYSAGTSEEYLGRALKKNIARDKVVVASKVYFNEGRLTKEAIEREIEGTLKRLGTDYLDLYMIHRFDFDTPIEETMEALHKLVKAGKVRAIGASAMYGYQFYNMQITAQKNGWTMLSAIENHYNLLYREDERELIPICRQMGVSLIPYSPLAAGRLARSEWKSDSLRSRQIVLQWENMTRWNSRIGRLLNVCMSCQKDINVRCLRLRLHGSGREVLHLRLSARQRLCIWMMLSAH